MKILFVSPSWWPQMEYGGPIIANRRIQEELSKLGHFTDVASYGMMKSLWKDFLWFLKHSIQKADVVHLTGVYNFSTFPTIWLCRNYHKPLVWSLRGSLQRWDSTKKRRLKATWECLCRLIAPPWTIIHCTSEQEAKETARVFSWPIRIVANGVDVPDTIERQADSRRLRILYLGRLDPKKGLESLIKACIAVPLPSQLSIIGSGEKRYVESLQELVGDSDKVRFVGAISHSHLADVFKDYDLTVVPSHTENFGQVIGESLAHSVPVIASQNVPWDLEDHLCGMRVPNDALSLTLAIWMIQQLPLPLSVLGDYGRAWIAKDFNWTDRANEMVKVFEFAIEKAR